MASCLPNKRTRGRPKLWNTGSLIETLLSYKDEIFTGRRVDNPDRLTIISKSHRIWKEMSEQLCGSISGRSLYSYIIGNNYGLQSILTDKMVHKFCPASCPVKQFNSTSTTGN